MSMRTWFRLIKRSSTMQISSCQINSKQSGSTAPLFVGMAKDSVAVTRAFGFCSVANNVLSALLKASHWYHDLRCFVPYSGHVSPPQKLQRPACNHHLRPPAAQPLVLGPLLNPVRHWQFRYHGPRTPALLPHRARPPVLLLWRWRHVRRPNPRAFPGSLPPGWSTGEEVLDEQ